MKKIIPLYFLLILWSCKDTSEKQLNDARKEVNKELNYISKKQPEVIKTTINTYKLKKSQLPVEIIEASVGYISPTFTSNNNQILSYELSVLNTYRLPFTLKKVEIYDVENSDTIFTQFDTSYLKEHFTRKGLSKGDDPLELKGNQFGIINIVLNLGASNKVPTQIFHKLIFEISNDEGKTKTFPMEVALMLIPKQTKIELALPFKKGKWIYGASSHRDSQNITEGKSTYPQRYAIDWLLITDDGYFVKGDIGNNSNWTTYGVEVLAVADGIIMDTKDSIIENNPAIDKMAVRMTRETIVGNYVVLDIGNNTSAVYAHLIPGSLQVKVGDAVKKGQVLGLLGNSDNSDAPHLHFHLETKSKITLGGEGIPYYFKEFTQLKTYTDDEFNVLIDKDKIPLTNTKSLKRNNELPMGNGLIQF